MLKVHVPVPGHEYDIVIGQDIYKSLTLPEVVTKNCFIVTDSNVGPLYLDAVKALLERNQAFSVNSVIFQAGEESKTLNTMQAFYSKAVKAGMDRKSIVIALGGGVTGDMAGFLAASYMRGIDFIQFPTSLLAMVDSSVGGKVGVDLPEGKNLVGAFWQPKKVVIDMNVLKTLPEREVRCGLAEIVKYGMIFDEPFLTTLEQNVDGLTSLDFAVYSKVIQRCCEIKAEVVAQDEKEGGIRAILNYGHTFGHSLEMLGGFSLLNHGEGVAIGMAMAADLSVNLGMIDASVSTRQDKLLKAIGLPVDIANMDAKEVLEGMRADKKVESGTIRLVLPNSKAGEVVITGEVSEEDIVKAIQGRII